MKLKNEIGEPALLELLAEECTELAHAALKLARVERKENPTPRNKWECVEAVIEEWADVIICLGEVSDIPWAGDGSYFEEVYDTKLARMQERLEERKRHENSGQGHRGEVKKRVPHGDKGRTAENGRRAGASDRHIGNRRRSRRHRIPACELGQWLRAKRCLWGR